LRDRGAATVSEKCSNLCRYVKACVGRPLVGLIRQHCIFSKVEVKKKQGDKWGVA